MQFMLLIYDEPARRPELGPTDWRALAAADVEFRRGLGDRLLANQVLEPPRDAVTVRFEHGRTSRAAGPAVDSQRWLVGCYTVECADTDAAAAIAADVPMPAGCGRVEIRPVLPVPALTPGGAA